MIVTKADLRVFRVANNPDQFAASGNPWICDQTWNEEVSIAQNPIAPTAERLSSLDFVRPGTFTVGFQPPPERTTPRLDTPEDQLTRAVLACKVRLRSKHLAPITEEDVDTFRRSVRKVTPLQHSEIKFDVDLDKVKADHARWMADEHAKLEKRKALVLAHKARLALEEAE